MRIAIPFIHDYSAKVQISAIAAVVLVSYLHRRARIAIAGLISTYLAFKLVVPVVGWTIYLFKGIAMIAFYIYFFKMGIGYAFTAVDFVFNDGLDALIKALETGRPEVQ